MGENIVKNKSYEFAIMIVRASEQLVANKKEYILSKQLVRSGTSIGALIREAEFGQSKADFINKLSIALKEANETIYWLCLLKDTNYLAEEVANELMKACSELISMLVASVKTAKSNN